MYNSFSVGIFDLTTVSTILNNKIPAGQVLVGFSVVNATKDSPCLWSVVVITKDAPKKWWQF
jgi:hypothetical protein